MRLKLHELTVIHSALRGHPVDLARYGGLGLQRGGHTSPAEASVNRDGISSTIDIEWRLEALVLLDVLDRNRVTEDGGEAVALSYVNAKDGWIVKRRLQRGEHADWLLSKANRWLALEVSGIMEGDASGRLKQKEEQVGKCTLPADRLAVVVQFDAPLILASTI
jgi:hypothetical protein